MDWDMAVKRNSAALRRVLAMLVALAGFDEGPHPEVRAEGEPRRALPRRLHLAVLRLLRPAEAAARRLIIIVARDIVVTLAPQRPRKPKPKSIYVRDGIGTGAVRPKGHKPTPRPVPRAFSLSVTDPMRRISRRPYVARRGVPRLSIPGLTARDPIPCPPSPDDEIDASRLALRLAALAAALDDLPGHAKRFARWQARSKARRIRRTWPLRTGRPPGQVGRRRQEVHDVLEEIHGLAFWVLDSPDTS